MIRIIAAALIALAQLPGATAAGWRGDGTGVVEEASLPRTWSDDEHLRWKTPLPNWGNGQPVAAGDIVVALSEPLDTAPILTCVARADGRVLWQHEIEHLAEPLREEFSVFKAGLRAANRLQARHFTARAQGDTQTMDTIEQEIAAAGFCVSRRKNSTHISVYPAEDKRSFGRLRGSLAKRGAVIPSWTIAGDSHHNGYSCWEGRTFAAPVSDGTHVWVWVSPGVAACYARDGTQRWLRYLDAFAEGRKPQGKFPDCTYTSAPVLIDDVLVCVGGDTVYGLEAETGKILWETPTRSRQGWEPQALQIVRLQAETGVLVHDGVIYRPHDGKILCDGLGDPVEGSAVVAGNRVFMQLGKRQRRIAGCWQVSEVAAGRWQAQELWTRKGGLIRDHDNRTPLVYGDRLYAAAGILDATTGEQLVEARRSRKQKTPEGWPRFFHSHSSAWFAGDVLLLHGPATSTAKGLEVPPAVTRVCDPQTLEVLAINHLTAAPVVGPKREQLLDHSSRGELGWGPCGMQTIFVDATRIFIRSHDFLFCVGKN